MCEHSLRPLLTTLLKMAREPGVSTSLRVLPFFMVVEGHMAFPNQESATAGIRDFARTVQRIELMWGDDLRVDPLASDLAVLASSYHEVRITTA